MHAIAPLELFVSRPSCSASCERSGDGCFFQVAWSINPHMRVGAVDKDLAVAQHASFVRTLERSGACVRPLPFVHGAFDSVFVKDSAIVVERYDGTVAALLAQPRYDERRAEQRARRDTLARLGVHVHMLGSDTLHLEGGDVVVLPGARGACMGYGFRSTARSGDVLARFLSHDVTSIELRDPRLYHLDMALSILDDGTAIVCEEALTRRGLRALEGDPRITSFVRCPLDEALAFGVNLVQIGRVLVRGAPVHARQTTTERALEALGYHVVRTPLDQFHHAGGSAACLVARVHRQRALRRRGNVGLSATWEEQGPESSAA